MRRIVVGLLLSCSDTRWLPDCVESNPDAGARIETGGDPVVLAAGDIVDSSDLSGARATASLLDGMNGVVAMLGDGANGQGALDELLDGYASTWGRHRWRTRPAVGNHEQRTAHAAPYFAYFCTAAGTPFDGWYSYEAGAWHVVVLNSTCNDPNEDEACTLGGPQLAWLRTDLAAHPTACTLAYWHHPLFSSAPEGDPLVLREAWQVLYDAGVDLVLNGHAHLYERFATMRPDGMRDDARGIREIVVGTGGAELSNPGRVHANSERQVTGAFGVLAATLHARSYDWRFVAIDGTSRDEGSSPCH